MAAYYNEFDPFAAAWLRELIKAGLIADGEIDERDIREVKASDLSGFTQCHFFAGIGVWSYALRLARWPDDRPVWTGSCPCPSFSTAGKGQGFADPRHLWPAWHRLIRECRPAIVFGEQVNAAIGHGWLDLVQSDLEAEGYAVGKAVLGACSVGAPHRRQRLYFVADAQGWGNNGTLWSHKREALREIVGRSTTGRLADAGGPGLSQRECDGRIQPERLESFKGQTPECRGDPDESRVASPESRFTAGFWRDAEWLWCRDGKWRAVEPGTFPLAHGVAARVGRLRGYGNGLCAPVAQAFIETYIGLIKADAYSNNPC